ncbi:hypothetical protein GLOIN_2v1478006 [Rhizophagus irregularis DAOM 181602=DAOM 197198]|uniref:Uncharacterized protein n=1 Tax=Rhizophagus irregularis (strain DAOM 181602 / DAOM 197198 / MUCL 43194) TaxID=747089 RepID=A0A2P4Q326_RHIID|nr:hypothetical protein GLOIN_2v1478006 [Rhizophagus irregularis DAOM 181602=DAOM 197198]POG72030.1 hypothetical protein GLOIN_2v1478006 [Rhizophagus irregularis DAOM 181602=DAOM 197198]|eukprot:XP_025178896.1 hypothetical protein GLOIN_2v1478006 [Rhizophagus irregularis DAOM 181602=DAOM 197198]
MCTFKDRIVAAKNLVECDKEFRKKFEESEKMENLTCKIVFSNIFVPKNRLHTEHENNMPISTIYDLLGAMFCFREELAKPLGAVQKLKVAKDRKFEVIDSVRYYMSYNKDANYHFCIVT